MISFRKHFVVAIIISLSVANPAKAQMAVINSTNLVQAVRQVAAWRQQYQQMTTQITNMVAQVKKAEQQFDALTGARGLGDIINNPLLRDMVPPDLIETYNSLGLEGFEGLSDAAKIKRAASMIYNCADRAGDDRLLCESVLSTIAQSQANQEYALSRLDHRAAQITDLQARINTTSDPKAIAELQARIQIEQANIQNDASRVMLLNAMAQSEHAAAQQRLKERTLRRFSGEAIATADTFHFKLPTP